MKNNLTVTPAQESLVLNESLRPYLGMSTIGHSCPRFLWYVFNWAQRSTLSMRETRLFARGHREEEVVLADLVSWGYIILGRQKEYTHLEGHIQGHSDALLEDPLGNCILLEVKTVSSKFWKTLIKAKTLRDYSEVYEGQVLLYLFFEQEAKYCLEVFVNKDTDERIYTKVERDDDKAIELLHRAADIVVDRTIPPKIGGPTFFKCKMCPYYNICHFSENINTSCRVCVYSQIHSENRWYCAKHSHYLTVEQQLEKCNGFTAISI